MVRMSFLQYNRWGGVFTHHRLVVMVGGPGHGCDAHSLRAPSIVRRSRRRLGFALHSFWSFFFCRSHLYSPTASMIQSHGHTCGRRTSDQKDVAYRGHGQVGSPDVDRDRPRLPISDGLGVSYVLLSLGLWLSCWK